MGLTLCIVHSVGLANVYSDVFPSLHRMISHRIVLLADCPMFFPFILFSPEPRATTDLFAVSLVLSFSEYYIVGVIQYVIISDCLLSLSSMSLRFLCIFSWPASLFFFFFCRIVLCCVDVPQFIYPVTCWRISWLFQVLAVMNKSWMQVFVWISIFNYFGLVPRSVKFLNGC